MSGWQLMRTWYSTDVNDDEPQYVGTFSGVIPGRVLEDGWQIVNIDWSKRGEVEVTYLVPKL